MDEKQAGVSFTMHENVALFEALNTYRKSQGWTWKRMCLLGMATSIDKSGDNPDLVVALVNYLTEKR